MEIDLRWVASLPVSGLHAADGLRRGFSLADRPMAAAVAGPAERLIDAIRKEALPEEILWPHLVALSADMEDPRQLVQTVLQKVIGRSPRAAALVSPLAAHVAGLLAGVRRALPGLVDQLTEQARPLMEAWDRYSRNLLRAVAELTDPGLLVSDARVIAVWPALGGGGSAHLWYNTVRIEAMPADPVPVLPEVVRLTWLLAQLQADLPGFSETIPRDRLHAIAAAAMLAPALAAAQRCAILSQDELPIERAIEAWRPADLAAADLARTIHSWWATYTETQPPWHVALAALDHMLHSESALAQGVHDA